MSLLSQASLVVVPSGYKEDVVYSVKPTDGSGDLTFTRASDGTRVNSQGLVERVPWNLFGNSENGTSGNWGNPFQIASVTANSITAPNGTNTGNLVVENSVNSTHWFESSFGAINGTPYTISAYFKAKERTQCALYAFTDNFVFSGQLVIFNLSTGVVVSQSGTQTNSIESVGSGWYRCSMTVTANASATAYFGYGLANGGTQSYQGDGTSGLYMWGRQLNTGTAKPYFPTTDRQNVPRLDYSGGCPSLLLEPQRTNLFYPSDDFSGGSQNYITYTANTTDTLDPSGQNTADKFVVTLSGDDAFNRIDRTIAIQNFSLSVYVKGTAGQKFQLFLARDTYAEVISTNVLTTGDWQRVVVSGTFSTTSSSVVLGFEFGYTSDDSVANQIYYLWGAQLEAGSYSTSYIPTTSASVTRVADATSIDPSSLLGATQGSWFMELNDLTFEVSGTSVPTNWLGLDVANCLAIEGGAAGQNKNIYFVKEESNVVTTLTTKVISGTLKACFVWNGASLKCFVNGVKEYDASGFTQPSSWSTLEYNYSGREAQQLINQTILFPTSLTDAEAIALTTL